MHLKIALFFSRVLPSRPRGSTLAPSPLLINKNKYWYPKKKKRISSPQRRDNTYKKVLMSFTTAWGSYRNHPP